jgi:hypothetical protein
VLLPRVPTSRRRPEKASGESCILRVMLCIGTWCYVLLLSLVPSWQKPQRPRHLIQYCEHWVLPNAASRRASPSGLLCRANTPMPLPALSRCRYRTVRQRSCRMGSDQAFTLVVSVYTSGKAPFCLITVTLVQHSPVVEHAGSTMSPVSHK